jgi:hypothetical protein
MFLKIKSFIYGLKFFKNDDIIPNNTGFTLKDVVNERTKKQNFSALKANSLVPHDINCEIIGCNKVPCFVSSPDKIVGKTYKVCKKTKKKIE